MLEKHAALRSFSEKRSPDEKIVNLSEVFVVHTRKMLIVDPFHWLDRDGDIPAGNLRLRTRLLSVLRVIEYGSALRQGESCGTLIECKKRPGGRRCLGLLRVTRTKEDSLFAFCPQCDGEHMLVSNWQKTKWARGGCLARVSVSKSA